MPLRTYDICIWKYLCIRVWQKSTHWAFYINISAIQLYTIFVSGYRNFLICGSTIFENQLAQLSKKITQLSIKKYECIGSYQ